ncbi:MAG: hypothetical protein M1833_005632 [Piccolia ochrophora]|nr:MAG: hypothetical protein M1833_005632 [Piccolia ochrophora]
MKLDTKAMRYLTPEDWRVLTAVEMGSKNHEVVPTPLISQIAGLRSGSGVHKCISNLAKTNLIARVKNAKYDGYRLTYGGLDYLALHTHLKRSTLYSTGNQIGTGKESDIFAVSTSTGTQHVLKIHRLGRISFRTVKTNRDYLRNNRSSSGSWMYMSRLAAMKEYAFLTALWENGFAVPKPIAQSRHTIVMELIDAFPLRQVDSVPNPAELYAELIAIILRLAKFGLIHGDFNEFNILIKETPPSSPTHTTDSTPSITPILIDFPQMLSIDHANAEMYFDRDVQCIKRFFERRFHFVSSEPGPSFAHARRQVGKDARRKTDGTTKRLDVEVEATGFSRKMAKDLEKYMKAVGVDGDRNGTDRRGEDEESGKSGHDEDASEDEGTDGAGSGSDGEDDGGDTNSQKRESDVPSILNLTIGEKT